MLYKLTGLKPCSNPARHKLLFISLETLQAHGITFSRIEQTAGDTVVLASRAFHFGFNKGNNLAIAVNFLVLQPSEADAFRLQTIYCNCGQPNLRFTNDYRSLANFVWQYGHWMPSPAK